MFVHTRGSYLLQFVRIYRKLVCLYGLGSMNAAKEQDGGINQAEEIKISFSFSFIGLIFGWELHKRPRALL